MKGTDLSTGRGFLLAILLAIVLAIGIPYLIMCGQSDGCPAYDVDLGGAER